MSQFKIGDFLHGAELIDKIDGFLVFKLGDNIQLFGDLFNLKTELKEECLFWFTTKSARQLTCFCDFRHVDRISYTY